MNNYCVKEIPDQQKVSGYRQSPKFLDPKGELAMLKHIFLPAPIRFGLQIHPCLVNCCYSICQCLNKQTVEGMEQKDGTFAQTDTEV